MNSQYKKLCNLLESQEGKLFVALSGGIDSITLMTVAARVRKPNTTIAIHAVSAAVPAEATDRCRHLSAKYGWQLQEIDALEMHNSHYVSNPVNRCYFCKSNLFEGIEKIRGVADHATIATGTNMDDLGDYRPGLAAAEERAVWQPYVEAGIGKNNVRLIATKEGLGELSQLPAQPCLASRVETGIAINTEDLLFIHRVEKAVTKFTAPGDIRCRLNSTGVVVQLPSDNKIFSCELTKNRVKQSLQSLCTDVNKPFIGFERYRMGSSFLKEQVVNNA